MPYFSLTLALAAAVIFTVFFYFRAKKNSAGSRVISKKRFGLALAVIAVIFVLSEAIGFAGLSPLLMGAGALMIVLG